ncbi:MAG: phage terminase large subunit [Bacteroidaceae bacterium]
MSELYDIDLIRAWTLQSSLHFTRYFFRELHDMKFIIGNHHRLICDALDDVLNGKCNKLIINIAPRFGKTEVAVKNFIAMGLAVNPASRFIHLSYSANLAQDNSIAVKNIVQSEAYQKLYPTRITYGKNMKSQWDTDQGGGLYATSTLGQITGFGAGLVEEEGAEYRFSGAIIIDDPIKPEDALSDVIRERVNRRFETTIRNRVNSRNTPIIIIMQRLHEHDLCGYLQEVEPDDWKVISLPVISINAEGQRESLWDYKFTVEELDKINNANSFVFETQYMQNPKPMEGLMYPHPFKTYDILPNEKLGTRCNYTDTADTGSDYLCSVCYLAMKDGYYVTDVLYTKKPMEFTEQATAQMVCRNNVRYCVIESNNGGRAFMRNVERLSREYGNHKTTFMPFTQTKNKAVRIFSRSAEVNNMIVFPANWERMWPEFAASVKSYRKEGNNMHDDAEDVLTGIIERGDLLGGASDAQILSDFL